MENDNINVDLKEKGFEDVDMIHLTQYRRCSRVLVNEIEMFLIPLKAQIFFFD
jgi:hypothetical protein